MATKKRTSEARAIRKENSKSRRMKREGINPFIAELRDGKKFTPQNVYDFLTKNIKEDWVKKVDLTVRRQQKVNELEKIVAECSLNMGSEFTIHSTEGDKLYWVAQAYHYMLLYEEYRIKGYIH